MSKTETPWADGMEACLYTLSSEISDTLESHSPEQGEVQEKR